MTQRGETVEFPPRQVTPGELPTRLDRLTSARAFAALSVFGYHASLDLHVRLWPFDDLGYAGVSFFFILSGFVLTWAASGPIEPIAFYRRRFSRIYPTYAAVLILVALVYFPDAPSPQLLPSLLAVVLCQAWLAGPGTYALNPPGWSLSVEAAFYCAMPWLHRRLEAMGSRRRFVGALGLFLASAAFVVVSAERGGALAYVALANPIVRSAEFIGGIVAALELRAGGRLRARLGLLIAAASVCLAAGQHAPAPIGGVELDPAFLVAIVALAQADCARRRSHLLRRRSLIYLGTISYEFYLVHQFVLSRLHLAFTDWGAALPLSLVAATAGSALLYEGLQRPTERLLRQGDASSDAVALRRRRLTALMPFVLVAATGTAIVTANFPHNVMPVRVAKLVVRLRIVPSDGAASSLVGSEIVNFASSAPQSSGSFLLSSTDRRATIDEVQLGTSLYWEVRPLSGVDPQHWKVSASPNGEFPGRPDDPASLRERVAALGTTEVVGHPLFGSTTMTKYKTTLSANALSGNSIVPLGLALPGTGRPLALTIWVVSDPDHLVRQLQYREVLADGTSGPTVILGNYSFTAFNDPMRPEVPPRKVSNALVPAPFIVPLFS